MGLFGHPTPFQTVLEPVDPPIGLNIDFCGPNVETLHMKHNVASLTGDKFVVNNEAGEVVLSCRGQAFTLIDKKVFKDSKGNPLFTIRNKIAIPKKQVIEAMDGTELCRVNKKFLVTSFRMVASFTNMALTPKASSVDPEEIELECKGDWLGRSATITIVGTDEVLGEINRCFLDVKDVAVGKQTYAARIAPGVDIIFMAALCVCFDEAYNEGFN